MKLDGKNPTLMYAYGGFEVSQTPSYGASTGKLQLERKWRRVRRQQHPRWRRPGLRRGMRPDSRPSARSSMTISPAGGDPAPAQDHQCAPPRHPRWLQRRATDRRRFHPEPRTVECGDHRYPAARHAAHFQDRRRRVMEGEYGNDKEPGVRGILGKRPRPITTSRRASAIRCRSFTPPPRTTAPARSMLASSPPGAGGAGRHSLLRRILEGVQVAGAN